MGLHVSSLRLHQRPITKVTCSVAKSGYSVLLMRTVHRFIGFILTLAAITPAWSASKPHIVLLGKPQTVQVFLGADESQSTTISVRPLYVDAKVKDYTTGDSHDVTDRLFVVQRAYRLNDSLPGDSPKQS